MPNLTAMEKEAISAARGSLWNALCAIGKEKVFEEFTADEVMGLIEAVWDGLRTSMQRQSASDIPF